MSRQLPPHFHLLIAMDFFSAAFTFAVPLMAPLLMMIGSLSPMEAAWVQCGAYLVTGLVQPYTGHLIDHGHFKRVLCVGGGSFSVGIYLFINQAHSFTFLVIGVIGLLFGLNAIGTLLYKSVIGGVNQRDRAFATGRAYLAHNLGFSVASTLAYFFLEKYRDELLFADLVTTLSVVLVMLYVFSKEKRLSLEKKSSQAVTKIPWKQIASHWQILSGITILWVLIFVHTSVTPLIFEKMGKETLEWTALLLITNTLVVVSCTGLFTKFANRYSERTMYLVAVSFYCTQGLVPYFLTKTGLVLLTIVWTLGEIASALLINQIIYRSFPSEQSGLASGLLVGSRSLGLFLAPLLGVIVLPMNSEGFLITLSGLSFFGFFLILPKLQIKPIDPA